MGIHGEDLLRPIGERNDASVGELAGLTPIAVELGVDPAEFERLVESDEIKDELIAETDRGLERGVFGVPTFFVGEQMFWGKDRMEFIDDELTLAHALSRSTINIPSGGVIQYAPMNDHRRVQTVPVGRSSSARPSRDNLESLAIACCRPRCPSRSRFAFWACRCHRCKRW